MNFFAAIKSCFRHSWNIDGRATRSEYWYWHLFITLASIPCNLLDMYFLHAREIYLFTGPLDLLFFLVTVLPSLCVEARRLHDVNRSFYWMFISMTIIGIIPLFYWSVIKGTTGDNRFGPDPLAPQIVH